MTATRETNPNDKYRNMPGCGEKSPTKSFRSISGSPPNQCKSVKISGEVLFFVTRMTWLTIGGSKTEDFTTNLH